MAKFLHALFFAVFSSSQLPEFQRGFRPEPSTIDTIFVARLKSSQKCREQQKEMNFGFIDLTKAFDTVNREILWKLLTKFSCPPTALTVIRKFFDIMLTRVSLGGASSGQLSTCNKDTMRR